MRGGGASFHGGAMQLRTEMVAHGGARFKCGGGVGSEKMEVLLVAELQEVVRHGAACSRHTPMLDGAVKMMKMVQVRSFTDEK